MIELLAPVGSAEALRAAVNAGADAVYLAGKSFGARAFADNFSNDELAAAIKFAHLHNVAVHITVNTIVADEEFAALDEYLLTLGALDVDALIIQDLGVASRARQLIPHIPLHASTQMTIHNLEGVRAAAELGFSRLVLARELSLDEIKTIVDGSEIEIEVFVHGALCVCTSGQCLMSSMIGARSGNRGRCAQPCRLPYDLIADDGAIIDAGKYILSPKDLNSIERLPQLIDAGVDSLKIEGRMKRPEYVAIVVETYRRALDRCIAQSKNYAPTVEEHRRLAQIFNRDFTTAYLDGRIDRNMISDKKPNNRGLPVGRVAAVDGRSVTIKAVENISVGDQIEIWIKVGGRSNFTVERIDRRGDLVKISVENTKGVRVHDRVFKIFDAVLVEHAQKIFEPTSNKIPIDAKISARIDEPLRLTIVDPDGNAATVETKSVATAAVHRPLDKNLLEKQIGRLGTTEFALKGLTVELDGDMMIPISELNDVRRRAIELLEKMRLKKFIKVRRPSSTTEIVPRGRSKGSAQQLLAAIDTLEKFDAVDGDVMRPISEPNDVRRPSKAAEIVPRGRSKGSAQQLIAAIDALEKFDAVDGVDGIIFGGDTFNHKTLTVEDYRRAIEWARSTGKKFYIGTPRIIRNSEQPTVEEILRAVEDADGVYVHNIGTLRLVKRLTRLPIFTDFSLIAFNSTTIDQLKNLGVEGVTLSPELTLEQIKNLRAELPIECIVGGRAELMIMFYCPIGSFAGCNRVCERKKFFLRDRMSAEFPIVTDQNCRAHILNSRALSMADRIDELRSIDRLRIDGRAMSAEELRSTIKKFRAAFVGKTIVEDGITHGHYYRGV